MEGTLNSRPLTYEYNNPEGEVLTPAHLIYGRRLHSFPEVTEEEDESESTSARRYKYLNQKLQHFWKRWQRGYSMDLRESHRMQGSSNRKLPKVGDLVTVYDERRKGQRVKRSECESDHKGETGPHEQACTKAIPLEVRAASLEDKVKRIWL